MKIKITPEQIKYARLSSGLTQTQAASLIYKALITWQQWEAGVRLMDPAFFELFLIKCGNHPNIKTKKIRPTKKVEESA